MPHSSDAHAGTGSFRCVSLDRGPWLAAVREGLTVPGQYLAYEEDERTIVHELTREWTRIGRSLAADIRFDDHTVSRRHALIVRQPDGVRVLDDRSLNGVFVNGTRVEWRRLCDGDELLVGKHHLHFVDVPAVSDTRDLRFPPDDAELVGAASRGWSDSRAG